MANAFLFSDLHASTTALGRIKQYISTQGDISLLLFAGDILNQGVPISFLEYFKKWLDSVRLPLIWVPGNNDFGRSIELFNIMYPSIEGREEKYFGRKFTGSGESSFINKEMLADSIFMTHYPPPGRYRYVLKEDDSSHAGFELGIENSPMQFADSPLLHICGHLHDQIGLAYIGRTKLVKLGSAVLGHCAIIDLQTLKVKFLRI